MINIVNNNVGPAEFDTVASVAQDLAGGGGRAGTMLTEFGLCKPNFDYPDSIGSVECEVREENYRQ